MSDRSAIEWTDTTWNPVTGCTKVSRGCDNCYAERIVDRFKGRGAFATVTTAEEKLTAPLDWRKHRMVFVNSVSDLFHDAVPDDFIARVFAIMHLSWRHTFQVLTKRPGRMRSLLNSADFRDDVLNAVCWYDNPATVPHLPWPLPNVWLGVSVEDQRWADVRIPVLLDTPAAVRWLSCEPLLGPVDLHHCGGVDAIQPDWYGPTGAPHPLVDWVVVGGESGPGARPMHPDWARSLRDQCTTAEVPFFFKQHGAWVEVDRGRATHLLQVDGSLVDRASATTDHPYGYPSGLDQDLVDRGHQGWVRVRRAGKKFAGRELDGRMWDEYPGGAS